MAARIKLREIPYDNYVAHRNTGQNGGSKGRSDPDALWSMPSLGSMAVISFQPLTPEDYPLLLSWLAKPHVREWWNDGDDTLEKVAAHYADAEAGTERFLIIQETAGASMPIGFIQFYTQEEGGMGIDLYLGEERLLNRGLGTHVLQAFIGQIEEQYAPPYLIIDPDPKNLRAIRCYQKVGFRYMETVLNAEGKPAYMMRMPLHRET